MSQMLDAALDYARQGWPIFPLTPRTKVPLDGTAGVLEATTDPAQIERWWTEHPTANIGLNVGAAGMMVIDLDPGHDFSLLEKNVGKLPKTELVQFTPRGGEHLFYALGEGETVAPSASKLAPKVDVRSFNSYVVLWPSVTADGAYEWENSATAKPAYRTDELYRKANVAREKSPERDDWIIPPDLDENIRTATRWLQREAQVAVQGRGGDHVAYATAGMMRSFGLSQETAFELMLEYWNERCDPPWSADEYEHLEAKVEHAYRYATSAPGNMTEAYREAKRKALFSPVERATGERGRQVTVGRFRIVDREGLSEIKPPEWLITGLLPMQSFGILHGQPGSFKTFIALDIALSIAATPSYPRPAGCTWSAVPGHGPVLYVAGEGRDSMKKRVRAWELTHNGGRKVENFYLMDPLPNVGSDDDIDNFLDAAQSFCSSYALVVYDTVSRAMQGLNENAQQDASRVTRAADITRRELSAASLWLAHEPKGEGSGRARGSGVFEGDADVVLRTERREKEMLVALYNSKQKDAEEIDGAVWIKLDKVDVDGAASLVAVKGAGKDVHQAIAKKEAGASAGRDPIAVTLILDKAIAATLRANTLKEWSTKEMAEALAMRPEIEVSSKTLQNGMLHSVRESKGTVANRCYDPSKRKWRWQN
jgi:hypothetical protein